MDIFSFSVLQFQHFLIVLARMAGIFTIAPFFGSRTTPPLFRIGLAAFLSLLFLPLIPLSTPIPSALIPFFLLVTKETLFGIFIGALVLFLFVAIQLAGQFIDVQIGYGIVNIIEPQSGGQVTLIGQVYYLFALLLFLVLDLHHVVIRALYQSFVIVPLGTASFSTALVPFADKEASRLFVIAFQLSAAPIAVLFLSEVAMGFIARTVPQMNIFLVGFPLRITLGLFFLFLLMPLIAVVLKHLFQSFFQSLYTLYAVMQASPP